MSRHSSHTANIKRLKRASGHLLKVINMIETDRPCPEVSQQLHAVSNAINNAKKSYIQDHIEHCVQDGLLKEGADVPALIKELKDISKYL